MAKDSQENPQEEIVNEFTRISQDHILRQYEQKNRERIAESSLTARDSFDRQWKKVIGKPYYLPVTQADVVTYTGFQNNTKRSDPRGRNYLAKVTFSKVFWQKLPRRKFGKRFKDLFNIKGIEKETGQERPIYQNQDFDQLSNVLGIKIKDQIQAESKTADHGEVDGIFDIDVEGYWQVIFSPQQSPNDPKDVRLMWEGQCLIIQRMKEVVLPGWYIEVADNAMRDHYTQTPEEGRKKIGSILEYPYTVLREASRQEYLELKASGDKVQKEAQIREETR